MYIGHGKVIEAPHTGASVHIIGVDVFKSHFVAARRVVPLVQGAAPATPLAPAPPAVAVGGPQKLSGTPAVQTDQAVPSAGGGAMTQPVPAVGSGGHLVDQVAAMGHTAYPVDGAPKQQIAAWM